MDFAPSKTEPRPFYLPKGIDERVKIVVVGPFGIGKTTAITTLSEIEPLHTDEVMTDAAAGTDHLPGPSLNAKRSTTVAIDFGRLTLEQAGLVLYLFGMPGQDRFRTLWDDIALGALGALVLVDTRRLEESFEVMGFIEDRGMDYAVAVNIFPESPEHDLETLRSKLDLEAHTPLVTCDARDWNSTLDALIALSTHALSRSRAGVTSS